MRTTERHQLKHDRFAETAAETYSWAIVHRNKLIAAAVVVAVVIAAVLGGWAYLQYRDREASSGLGAALRILDAPLRPPGTPAQPQMLSFTTAVERARAAHTEFEKVAGQYTHTNSGKLARYFAGLTAQQMGDNASAERELKEAADSGSADLSALARMALASLYRDTNREQQAIDIYQDLSQHSTTAVSKTTVQLELAQLYEAKQPQEAGRIYQQILKDDPQGPGAEIANARLQSLPQ